MAAEARGRGHLVVEGSRGEPRDPDERSCILDVTDRDQCADAVAHVMRTFGRLDVLANVAGFGAVAAVEETPEPLARALMETNFWGSVNMIREALPHMRAARSGHIINVSSLSGRTASAGVGFYAASKFAIEGLTEALHAELAPFGVHATSVEPGGVRTDWAKRSLGMEGIATIPDYDASAGRTRGILHSVEGQQPSTPAEVARAIVDLAELPAPPRRLAVGPDAVERIGAYYSSELEALVSSS